MGHCVWWWLEQYWCRCGVSTARILYTRSDTSLGRMILKNKTNYEAFHLNFSFWLFVSNLHGMQDLHISAIMRCHQYMWKHANSGLCISFNRCSCLQQCPLWCWDWHNTPACCWLYWQRGKPHWLPWNSFHCLLFAEPLRGCRSEMSRFERRVQYTVTFDC